MEMPPHFPLPRECRRESNWRRTRKPRSLSREHGAPAAERHSSPARSPDTTGVFRQEATESATIVDICPFRVEIPPFFRLVRPEHWKPARPVKGQHRRPRRSFPGSSRLRRTCHMLMPFTRRKPSPSPAARCRPIPGARAAPIQGNGGIWGGAWYDFHKRNQ